jgi:FHS family L-fucose permease-like MFS transporter
MASFNTSSSAKAEPTPKQDYTLALVSLMVLFFMMGFITCLNDILIPTLKGAFSLTYFQAMLIQFCFFAAYLFMSIPSGKIIQKVGYKNAMIFGFVAAGVGCLLFLPAASSRIYGVFLLALFVLATGITLLQVAANPYVAVLGSPEKSSARLTLTQAFNSLGTTIAPTFGTALILSSLISPQNNVSLTPQEIEQNLNYVKTPYLGLAAALMIIALIVYFLKLPDLRPSSDSTASSDGRNALSYRHLVFGSFGIFAYVGAEVAIGSFLINYMMEVLKFSEDQAGPYLTYYWGGAMVGRFVGALVLQQINPAKVLIFNALVAVTLISTSILSSGFGAVYALLAIGFFNSIMFATIFTLAIKGLGRHTDQASGILCTAIFGGAAIPALQGLLADSIGLRLAFLLPILCYLYIAWYGWKGHIPKQV